MSRRRQWDESDIKVRPGKSSRPRTKRRPAHADAVPARVVTVDRGRWGCIPLETPPGITPDEHGLSPRLSCVRARTLGRTGIVVGDVVDIVGDLSGTPGSLARIVRVQERSTVLRRTADDTDPYERIVVANADQLLIVVASADPPPRTGFVERALVAAYVAGLEPVLCMTKTDLANPRPFLEEFAALDLRHVRGGVTDDVAPVAALLTGRITALIGHSGVGKSTLVNRLVSDADRATGDVDRHGRGQHTSTQSLALPLLDADNEANGWVIDTPGIRSFGLAHVTPDRVIEVFDDLAAVAHRCPRGCTHLGPPADPDCALDAVMADHPDAPEARRSRAVRRLLTALHRNDTWALGIDTE